MGGKAAVAGSPSLMTAVGCNRLASTTALVKWVVPIITPEISDGLKARRGCRPFSAAAIPEVTSAVVGVLNSASTSRPSIRTASVLVPPTSTPTLIPAEARGHQSWRPG